MSSRRRAPSRIDNVSLLDEFSHRGDEGRMRTDRRCAPNYEREFGREGESFSVKVVADFHMVRHEPRGNEYDRAGRFARGQGPQVVKDVRF